MSLWNKIAALITALTLFAAPSFADGIPGQKVNRGPTPLKAHKMTPPEPGCVLVEGNKWSCPVPAARFTHAPAPKYHAAPVTRTTSTRTYTRTHAPTVTRRAVATRTVATSQEIKLDMGAFNGGVGAGVGTEFYGGGGTIIIGGGKRYSGVLSHAASRFTFRHRGGGGGKHHPRPRPCGCH